MLTNNCNIDATDRVNRIIIGIIICIAALFGASWIFYLIAGLVLIVEGIIGRCYIPSLVSKVKKLLKW